MGVGVLAIVTGSNGFIGTNLSLRLLELGHQVIGIDALTDNYDPSAKIQNGQVLKDYNSFESKNLDLLKEPLEPILDEADVVFHLAGQPSVQNSWGDDFQIYVDRNIVLSQRILRAALNVGVSRVVNSSSSSVYGKVKKTPTNENDEKSPVSPYGVTKLAGENLSTLYGREFGLSTVSLRYFTVYGPRQRPDMAFNKLIHAGLGGTTFNLHGDGTQIRDFTHVDDVVEANLLAATAQVDPGSVFNVGGGSPVSMSYVIEEIGTILGRPVLIKNEPFGAGNPMITEADCRFTKEQLHWTPKIGIKEGLLSQIDWQRNSLHARGAQN